MNKPIRKAVIPVAGLGTRFLPATKAMPKEMLTVVDRPALQYVVDEAFAAGVEHVVLVTGRGKSAIEDHFDRAPELEDTLKARDKSEELQALEQILPEAGRISYVRQQAPLGLGHAVWCARDVIGLEPFALLLPDVLIKADKGALAQMADIYGRHGGNIIAVEEVPQDQTHQYGIVALGESFGDTHEVTGMVEKPASGTAPSNLIITGRYILQPEIFAILERGETGAGGEVQITDAMLALMEEQPFHAYRFEGRTFDCGTKAGFLAANVAYALSRPDIAPAFRDELRKLLTNPQH